MYNTHQCTNMQVLISEGKYAQLLADNRPFTSEEAALFDDAAQFAYQSFRNRAAESRGMDIEAMQAVAQGRVWSGMQASQVLLTILTTFDYFCNDITQFASRMCVKMHVLLHTYIRRCNVPIPNAQLLHHRLGWWMCWAASTGPSCSPRRRQASP